MIESIANLLDLTNEDIKYAKTKRTEEEKHINKYIVKNNKTVYGINNLTFLGIDSSIFNDLLGTVEDNKKKNNKEKSDNENTVKIKKIAKGWQFSTIDWYAIQDFMRAYNCSKTEIVTYSLRNYLPNALYDNSVIQLISEFYPGKNVNISAISKYNDTFNTIDEYNAKNEKGIISVTSNFEKPLISFSLDFFKVDALAAQLFNTLTGFSYNLIIKNALRSFLTVSNYQNAEEILHILKKQDVERVY